MKSKKWFSENKDILTCLNEKLCLEVILPKLKTNSITKTKNALSKSLITDVYINRFNEELKSLNPKGNIKVELVPVGKKTKTSHKISIKGAVEKKNTDEILSEGEARVVSIAAFLADLNSINKTQAFIFDDPITSLDHNYEDNVAKQLVELSFERQVIVFTHRIAFAETLKDCIEEKCMSEKKAFNYIELLDDPLGEPQLKGGYNNISFDSVLNSIKNQEIPKIRKLKADGEYDLARAKTKEVCTNMRINIESGIEKILLNGVVTRYNKIISSLKIRYLKCINDEDIDLFNKMMTKYSFNEHSNPSEKPVPLTDVQEILDDVNLLLEWHSNFKSRSKRYDKK